MTLIFSPELTRPDGTAVFIDGQGYSYSKATWGLEVAHRRTPEEKNATAVYFGRKTSTGVGPNISSLSNI